MNDVERAADVIRSATWHAAGSDVLPVVALSAAQALADAGLLAADEQSLDIDGHTWTVEEVRLYAEGARDQHTPSNQQDNPYDRCAHCHFTRHPCEVYDLASLVLALIEVDEVTP